MLAHFWSFGTFIFPMSFSLTVSILVFVKSGEARLIGLAWCWGAITCPQVVGGPMARRTFVSWVFIFSAESSQLLQVF